MHLSNESLIVIIIVGIVAGWLAGQIVRGGGFGLIGDLIVGIIGAFIGDWLLPRLNIHLGVGTVSLIINATIGAIVLLIIIRLLAGNRGWGRQVTGVRRRVPAVQEQFRGAGTLPAQLPVLVRRRRLRSHRDRRLSAGSIMSIAAANLFTRNGLADGHGRPAVERGRR
jgi:uncharacterized membrane protein YeaQ/YmgE (transglycosylase-associated protein family)